MTFLSTLTSWRFAQTMLLALCWLLIVRASYILQSGLWPNPVGMIASDLAGALTLAVLLSITAGAARVLLIVILGSAAFVAGMHLTVHGTFFQLALIGKGVDPTFITGSLINRHSLLLPVYLLSAWLLHWSHRQFVTQPLAESKGLVIFATLVVAVYGFSFQSLTTPTNNLVASFFSQIPVALVSPFISSESSESEMAENAQEMPGDTNFFHQQVVAPYVKNPPNVLLIMVEGLSAGYFPSVSDYHNLNPAVELKSLEKNLARHGFRIYKNALSMERQTDRGTFTILCGEYPDFRRHSRKMVDVVEERASVDCMPSKLLESGYTTAYWQAAPLGYMQKGEFMPRVGFEDVSGAEVFTREGEEIDGWGPPDPVYFNNIGKRLRKLDATSAPWMVTLLNVGTHHPFNTGKGELEDGDFDTEDLEELADTEPQEARRKAMKTMEEALNRFLDGLASDGILDDTLVILTSDESGGFIREDPESLPLNSNVGVMAVRPPKGDSLARYAPENQIVAQIDIPPTILDITGLGRRTGDMIGRSLLVQQNTTRDLLLADTYTGLKYFLRESGKLLSCSELMTKCSTWQFDPKRLFGTLKQTETAPFLTFEERTALLNNASYMKPVESP